MCGIRKEDRLLFHTEVRQFFQALVYRKNKEKLEERRPEKIIINKLMRHFSLDEQQAKNYYDKYAKEGNYGSLSTQS